MNNRLLTLFAVLLPSMLFGQCPQADDCWNAIHVPANTNVSFCNDSCHYDYYLDAVADSIDDYTNPILDNYVGLAPLQCHFINYDFWYEIDFTDPYNTGFMCLNIWDGDCAHPNGSAGNYGPLEGWALMLWYGDTCESADLIWSTSCYSMTSSVPGVVQTGDFLGVDPYDPTRQEWFCELYGLNAGHYFVQIDSFGWCRGCGNFSWCDDFLLLQTIEFSITEINGFPSFDKPLDSIIERSIDLDQWQMLGDVLADSTLVHFGQYYYRARLNGAISQIRSYQHTSNHKVVVINGELFIEVRKDDQVLIYNFLGELIDR